MENQTIFLQEPDQNIARYNLYNSKNATDFSQNISENIASKISLKSYNKIEELTSRSKQVASDKSFYEEKKFNFESNQMKSQLDKYRKIIFSTIHSNLVDNSLKHLEEKSFDKEKRPNLTPTPGHYISKCHNAPKMDEIKRLPDKFSEKSLFSRADLPKCNELITENAKKGQNFSNFMQESPQRNPDFIIYRRVQNDYNSNKLNRMRYEREIYKSTKRYEKKHHPKDCISPVSLKSKRSSNKSPLFTDLSHYFSPVKDIRNSGFSPIHISSYV